MKRIAVVLLSLTLLAVLAGCGGSKPPAAATPAPVKQATAAKAVEVSPTEAADTTEPTAEATEVAEVTEPTEEPVVEATADTGSADLGISDEETALKNLKSYKSNWSFEWTGKKDGKDDTVKWVSTEQYTADPLATYTKFESSDSLQPGQGGSIEYYQIGNKTYMVSQQDGKTQCMAFSASDSKPTPNTLDRSAFGSISSGQFVGNETVNGVPSKHYKYDEKATGLSLYSKLNGDVWVATDGGFVVKDMANWEGNYFGLVGDKSTDVGKGTWTREVTDVNQAFTINPPEGCENPAEGLPIMQGAAEQASFGQMTTYKVTGKLDDVAAFYKTAMPKAGWTADGEPTISEGFGSMSFSKDGKKANVILTAEEDKVNVMITVE